ncbi:MULTISPECIES: thiol-disulfide oxidoreductase DCC family protein [Ignavibacterium]|uniref:thiol-disulfide oxidoreductase DCC family protein n=1 Tax=Ignavibacterium TaxID=795750 RepID=UPI0025BC6375|nr:MULTISPECIES: thiol-disulfide oxidoreductase DCC family protein [Ignavibacterium]MBI5663263.1 thiol-disulfide oxidoreductase DCC family protein [Ignavibacterium album]
MNKKIILFDGVCNFCNFWVNFIINRDSDNSFLFSALQSESGQEILKSFNLSTTEFDTFILVDGDQYLTRSDAVISIAKNLKGFPKILIIGKWIPKFFRDFLYDLVAKSRYKIFGKRQSCRIPTPEEKSRFLN